MDTTHVAPRRRTPFRAALEIELISAWHTYMYFRGRSHLAGTKSSTPSGKQFQPMLRTSEVSGSTRRHPTLVLGSLLISWPMDCAKRKCTFAMCLLRKLTVFFTAHEPKVFVAPQSSPSSFPYSTDSFSSPYLLPRNGTITLILLTEENLLIFDLRDARPPPRLT